MNKILYSALLFFLFATTAMAQTDSLQKKKILVAPWFVEKFKVSAGAFFPINNTSVQVSATGDRQTIGSIIDFENDLGLKRAVGTFYADFQYRLTRRSRFDLSYYRFSRGSDYTLKKDIVFGEDTFKVDASINASFKTNIYRFSYGYSIIEKPNYEVGLLIGTHVVHTSAFLGLNTNDTSASVQSDFGFTAPLPDFGIWGGYAFNDKLAITAEVDYFSLTIGDINGRIIGGSFQLLFHAMKNLDIAFGYVGLNFKIEATKPKLQGNFKWGYNGPSILATYSFGKKPWVHQKLGN